MTIGEKIRTTREAKGLTVNALSSLSGIDNRIIKNYESDKIKPKQTTLAKIADALDVDLFDLLILNSSNDFNRNTDGEGKDKHNSVEDNTDLSDNPLHAFATQLKSIRESQNLSQQMLEDALGIPEDYIDKYEREEAIPSIITLARVSKYFNVTADFLLGRTLLTEKNMKFMNFVSFLEILSDLSQRRILPEELYTLCRNALVDDYISEK